jgi:hypothetical protein
MFKITSIGLNFIVLMTSFPVFAQNQAPSATMAILD